MPKRTRAEYEASLWRAWNVLQEIRKILGEAYGGRLLVESGERSFEVEGHLLATALESYLRCNKLKLEGIEAYFEEAILPYLMEKPRDRDLNTHLRRFRMLLPREGMILPNQGRIFEILDRELKELEENGKVRHVLPP